MVTAPHGLCSHSHSLTHSLSLSLSLSLSVVHAYDVTLRASKKREQELQEQLNAAQRDSQETGSEVLYTRGCYVWHAEEDGC